MNRHPDTSTDPLSVQMANNVGYQLTTPPNSGQASAFTNANDVRFKNSSLHITNNVNTASKPTLDVLYQRVAPHAISNEGGRADDPKCYPGTRKEVIGLLEKWIDATDSDQILWLSGPAGGGKTAIVKTISERSTKRGVCTINFFFFRGDSTRKGAQQVVPTLLYQLFEFFPLASEAVASIFSTRPRILDGSLAEQCKLISIISPVIRQSLTTGARVLILVNGLDECDLEAERSQGDLIRVFAGLVMEDDSPFRLLVASRPEARIRMAFNQLSSPAQTIFLDEQYSPENDIRVFVTAEFDRIKVSHPSARLLKGDWPLPSDVDAIVHKSSGQFIYAATVMRYVSQPSTVPSLSLQRVQGIVPVANNSPFAHLDSIYTYILAQADGLEATREILSVTFLDGELVGSINTTLLRYYNSSYSQALVESCVSQLSAIVQLTASDDIKLYHASLSDFLVDKDRSGVYWIDVEAFKVKVLVSLWKVDTVAYEQDVGSHLQYNLFIGLGTQHHNITHMLLNLPLPKWFSTGGGLDDLHNIMYTMRTLYYKDDVTYNRIYDRFLTESDSWSRYGHGTYQPRPKAPPSKVHIFLRNWWRTLLNIMHKKN